jgi:hypothetical protein
MVYGTFSELFRDYVKANHEKCPDLMMPQFRQIAKDPPFPSGTHHIEYDRLNFKAFLNCLYPNEDLHTNSYTSASILKDLKNAYPDFTFFDTNFFFQTHGALMNVPFFLMKYYQDEIDLRGRNPFNGGIDEPVLVVQYSGGKVLYNGYHRASIYMLNGNKEIQAYVLKV